MRIFMFLYALLLFLFISTCHGNEILLNQNEMSYCKEQAKQLIERIEHNFDEQNILLNLLYHMYYFAQLDAVYRKNIALGIDQLLNAQDNFDPSHGFNDTHLKQIFSQIVVLEHRRSLHGKTWLLLDEKINSKHEALLCTIETIKEASEQLIIMFAQRCTPEINQMLQNELHVLELNTKTTHILARTLDILLNQAELLDEEKETQTLTKINVFCSLSNSFSKEIKRLINSKEACTANAYTLQLVAAQFFRTCYETLHDKVAYDFPDRTVQLFIANNDRLVTMDEINAQGDN